MILEGFDDHAAGGVGMVASVVTAEASAEDIFSPVHLLAVDLVRQGRVEAMIGGTQRDEGFAGVDILHDEFALRHRQGKKAAEEDHLIGLGQVLEARNMVRLEFLLFTFFGIDRHAGVDQTIFVDGVEHGTIKAVMGTEDLREHRHRLFAPVFLVGGDEYDVLPLAGAFTAFVGQPEGVLWVSRLRQATEAKQEG